MQWAQGFYTSLDTPCCRVVQESGKLVWGWDGTSLCEEKPKGVRGPSQGSLYPCTRSTVWSTKWQPLSSQTTPSQNNRFCSRHANIGCATTEYLRT